MKKLKWKGQAHIVHGKELKPGMVDMHSHGLESEIGYELQYVIDRGNKEDFGEIQDIFSEVATKVLNGKIELKNDVIYYSELFGCQM